MAQLTALQVAAAAMIGGFSGNDIVEAVKVAYGESSWNTTASNSCCYGLWQINKNAHADLFRKYKWDNPADNARMANIIFQKAGSLLHPEGRWCSSGHPPNGCNPWQAYGNAAYNSKDAEAKAAYAELRKQISQGKSAESILGTSRTDGSKTPEAGIGGNIVGAVSGMGGIISAINRAGAWITNPDNLRRILKVLMGAGVILVGAAIILEKPVGTVVSNVVPAGKAIKKVSGK